MVENIFVVEGGMEILVGVERMFPGVGPRGSDVGRKLILGEVHRCAGQFMLMKTNHHWRDPFLRIRKKMAPLENKKEDRPHAKLGDRETDCRHHN